MHQYSEKSYLSGPTVLIYILWAAATPSDVLYFSSSMKSLEVPPLPPPPPEFGLDVLLPPPPFFTDNFILENP